MAANGFTRIHGSRNFAHHFWVCIANARKIHYLAKANNIWPVHGLCHIFCVEFRTGIFQTRSRRHTGWHLHKYIDRHAHGFVMHCPHPIKPKHIGNLVRVNKHRSSAVRNNSACELGYGQHATFNMHMRVTQAGHQIFTFCINHSGFITDAVAGIRSAIGKSAAGYGKVGSFDDFTRVNIHPLAVFHDKVSRFAACCNIYQLGGKFCPCFNFSHFFTSNYSGFKVQVPTASLL